MRRGVAVAITIVFCISIVLSILLFQLTQPGNSSFSEVVITQTVTVPNLNYNESQSTGVVLETYDWTSIDSLVLTLRNVGSSSVQFVDWYIDSKPITSASGSCVTTPLDVGTACTVTLFYQQSYSTGYYFTQSIPYAVKVVTVDGQAYLYCIVDGESGSASPSIGDCTHPQLLLESYNWYTATSLILVLRNEGSIPIRFADWFINGIAPSGVTGCATELTAGTSCIATLTIGAAPYSAGVTYEVKVVTLDGSMFSFQVTDGSAN